MLSDKMQQALNEQLRAEMYSSNLYLAMAAYFDAQTLEGFAHWLKVQAKEEMGHAMKFYGHIKDRLGRVSIGAMDEPPGEWDSPLAAFETVYEHECKVSAMIRALLDLAGKEKDPAAAAFLQWFITEQVEEEAQADAIVQKLKMIGKAAAPLLMYDAVLGKRES
jgi:ferritin